MRSVITGGAGFLGSHLAEKLVTLKHDVIVLVDLLIGKIEYKTKVNER